MLTKLPDRTLLLEQLTRVTAHLRQSGRSLALLSLDIDGFKRINDSIGPTLGDHLLAEASARIVTNVKASDTVGRLGSDKFAVMIPDIGDAADADRAARSILDAFQRPFLLDGREVVVSASIGVALFPQHGGDALALLQRADAAMAQAKATCGNAIAFFETEMNALAERRHATEIALRRALKCDQLVLHYQPVIDCATQRVVAAEALLRWHHPDRGLVTPADFIPVAEESGLIVDIGRWSIECVQEQQKRWRGTPLEALRVAVNVSARELRKPKDLDVLLRLIARAPSQLAIEITESALLSDAERLLSFLSALRELGVRVALDDFGTGYSSFAYLRRFRFDTLKIDRSFVEDLETSDADRALVTSITSLGRTLGLEVIAEGVETSSQLAWLERAGCTLVQGHYFAKAMTADDFRHFVAIRSISA
jgi:diguanylate cyclase (GGDEF)-like protein